MKLPSAKPFAFENVDVPLPSQVARLAAASVGEQAVTR